MSASEQKSRRLGRPRKFDAATVVANARDLFWQHGPRAVSHDQLTVVTALHRPSLYAAFDDKRGLFVAALRRYREDSTMMVATALAEPTLRQALAAFFAADLRLFVTELGGRGCFILGVAAEEARGDPELSAMVESAWQALSAALSERIERAPETERPPGLRTELLTDLVLATHVTLAMRARAGEPRSALDNRVARLLGLFGP